MKRYIKNNVLKLSLNISKKKKNYNLSLFKDKNQK